MSDLVLLSRQDDVLIVTVNNPPVNALSPGVAEGIADAVRAANADDTIRAVVVIGSGKTFIAGADIREFPKIISGERPPLDLHPPLNAIEMSAKPVVMAIHGTALGGGLEVAMAGHYRVASPTAQVGQPEVKLGLIPGAGGTQRLPRLCGIEKALAMCVFGDPINASDAYAAGIVDQLIEGDLLRGAVEFARGVTSTRRTRDRSIAPVSGDVVERIRATAQAKLRRQSAPLAAIDAITASVTLPFDEGIEHERKLFEQCLHGPQAKALIHVFFAERETAKLPFLSKNVKPLPVARAGVVGAGTMGRGIAMCFANAGIPVTITDLDAASLDRARDEIARLYARSVKSGRLSEAEAEERQSRIRYAALYDGFSDADVIVEAVFEGMVTKQHVFAELDAVARDGCVLATNTSTLDIDIIASATKRREFVAGLHFFSPAHLMRLIEVVRGAQTSDAVLATLMDLGRKLKKLPVLSGNRFGFIGNRMFDPYRAAAIKCVEQGATPLQVDTALEQCGMAMGPLAVGDLSGLDIMLAIRGDASQKSVEDVLVAQGRLGQKTRAGWYTYEDGTRQPDPAVDALIDKYAAEHAIPRRKFTDDEIASRCIATLQAEGRRVLDEGVALRPGDIDMVYVHGYGYPAWRGGPMFLD